MGQAGEQGIAPERVRIAVATFAVYAAVRLSDGKTVAEAELGRGIDQTVPPRNRR